MTKSLEFSKKNITFVTIKTTKRTTKQHKNYDDNRRIQSSCLAGIARC